MNISIEQIRSKNLKKLSEKFEGDQTSPEIKNQGDFAKKILKMSPGQLSELIKGEKRTVSFEVARRIETDTGQEEGWLDYPWEEDLRKRKILDLKISLKERYPDFKVQEEYRVRLPLGNHDLFFDFAVLDQDKPLVLVDIQQPSRRFDQTRLLAGMTASSTPYGLLAILSEHQNTIEVEELWIGKSDETGQVMSIQAPN